MDDFTNELIDDFLEEAFSLIDNLETSLLELEKNSEDSKAINEVFRVAHTIKGGAGTVGFDEIQNFTHIMEDVFDLVRKDRIKLNWDTISMLLQCRDELEKMLTAREQGEVRQSAGIEKLLGELKQLKDKTEGRTEAPAPVKVAEKKAEAPAPKPKTGKKTLTNMQKIKENLGLSNYDISNLQDKIAVGRNVFLIIYELNDSYEMKEVSAFQLFSLISDIADIVKMKPNTDDFEKKFYSKVIFLIHTDKDEQFIKEKTNLAEMIDQQSIYALSSEQLSSVGVSGEALPDEAPKPSVQAGAGESSSDEESDKKPTPGDAKVEKRSLATLRIESWKVDNLLNLLGELVLTKATFSQLNDEYEKSTSEIKLLLKEFLSGITKLNIGDDSESTKERNDMLLAALQKLFQSAENYGENIQKLNRISSSLQENVMNMRMVPIQMIFSRFPRLVRDIAGKMSKEIDLEIEGVETEIDKGMVDDIFDPLIHLLRNSIDHGIESPEERKQVGKSEVGKIVLKAVHEGDSIMIEVKDDGRGIDTDKVREKAINTGILKREDAEKMSQRELLSLIFMAGFSTAEKVSNISGRGVGMDAVKKKIEEIGGNVGIATVQGKGTRIIIRLPLTLAIIQGLLIVVEGMYYVIPVASVQETVIVSANDFKEINGQYAFEFREKLVPILPLKRFFYGVDIFNSANKNEKEYCILIKYGERSVGIIVSEVIGEQDIVIKPLNTKLIKSPGISAATIVGNGDIGYIIDTAQVISHYFKTMK